MVIVSQLSWDWRGKKMTQDKSIDNEVIDNLLKNYKKREDLIGENGLLRQTDEATPGAVVTLFEAAKRLCRVAQRLSHSIKRHPLAQLRQPERRAFVFLFASCPPLGFNTKMDHHLLFEL
jgi:hypothetical protein